MENYDFETWEECFNALYEFFSKEIYLLINMDNYDYYINDYKDFENSVIIKMQEYDIAEEWLDDIDNKGFEDMMKELKICLNEFLESKRDLSKKDRIYVENFWSG